MTASLESRLERLERDAGKPVRYCVVNDPPTEAQLQAIAALEAEGFEVRRVANPYRPRVNP